MGIIRALIELFSKRNLGEVTSRVSRRDLGNGFYITYEEASNGIGYRDVDLCLHNENDPSFCRQITNHRGDFISFPGYVKGSWEKWIKVNFSESVNYPSRIGVFKDGKAEFKWQVQPDGRYYADEGGYGMENCEEIWLRSYLDENGNFTEPFEYDIEMDSIMNHSKNYSNLYTDLGAATVRGYLLRNPEITVDPRLLDTPLDELTDGDIDRLISLGRDLGIKLYRFKCSHEDMPRVRPVMGFLRAVQPISLVDVGSGRGVFLFPFLSNFPRTSVTSLDILDYRVEFLKDIAAGGISRLTPMQADICQKPLPDKSADVVTMLEVLEHIPDVQAAISAAVRISRRYVVVSVPSKPDDNPEHIHLLTKPVLTEYFENAGCTRLSFSEVNGHLILIAMVGGE